ncbi:TolC family protein [Rhodopirellula sp. MGV]|uniref:TolC family protein n=1 Tax=Rhodopirellula sp. MGV TaxID=2023130 RepID=UPI000B972D28|nr:TolC family protein [Rhodopirellula sp. MGV]OYP30449.1 secretion protein [Rhodopirellula sp. MGV]PNY34795.1 TolC family protein [Rhodopirellula baltica]
MLRHRQSTTLSARRAKRNLLHRLIVTVTVASTTMASTGCHVWDKIEPGPHDTTLSYHENVGMSIEYPEVAECATPVSAAAESTAEPHVLQDPSKIPALEMTLPEAMTMAMQNSPVIRTLAAVVPSSQTTQTIYSPGQTASSAQGVEAALSNFDAQYTNSLMWSTQDEPQNIDVSGNPALGNVFIPFAFARNAAWQSELRKKSATGSTFSLRHVVNYSRNNRVAQRFHTSFAGWVEAEWRQPLLKGAGLQYNRIVGNSQIPGTYNGVLIARINEDVALADYERSVIQLASDVEEAYWNLWTAYRLLEANIKGRESALKTYQYQNVRLEVGAGRQDEEAQAQSQFYQFEANVQNQLGGPTGLYAREQRLRYLLGMPAADGKLLRPSSDPMDMQVVFDWNSALSQALDRRVEIRRQRFQVKRREFELYAANLGKRPTLDVVGLYRWRGFGDHLIGDNSKQPFDGMYATITDGNYQEWAAGFEFALPVGLRAASTAVANAKLQLQRERAVLAETELAVSHNLADDARSVELTFQLVETNYNRYQADLRQVEVLLRRYLDGTDNINFLLQAQRSVVQSESAFYQALSNYNLAIRDLHVEKGSLLAYNQIQLAEGEWGSGANRDAYEKGLFLTPRHNPSEVTRTPIVTSQKFDPAAVQQTSAVSTAMPMGPMGTGVELPGEMLSDDLVEVVPESE